MAGPWRAAKAGKLRKLASRLYTSNMADPPEAVVARNLWNIVAGYFPGALVADRTALENAPASDGSVCLITESGRNIKLPGHTLRPRRVWSSLRVARCASYVTKTKRPETTKSLTGPSSSSAARPATNLTAAVGPNCCAPPWMSCASGVTIRPMSGFPRMAPRYCFSIDSRCPPTRRDPWHRFGSHRIGNRDIQSSATGFSAFRQKRN